MGGICLQKSVYESFDQVIVEIMKVVFGTTLLWNDLHFLRIEML